MEILTESKAAEEMVLCWVGVAGGVCVVCV
jgi:hypothetical protein